MNNEPYLKPEFWELINSAFTWSEYVFTFENVDYTFTILGNNDYFLVMDKAKKDHLVSIEKIGEYFEISISLNNPDLKCFDIEYIGKFKNLDDYLNGKKLKFKFNDSRRLFSIGKLQDVKNKKHVSLGNFNLIMDENKIESAFSFFDTSSEVEKFNLDLSKNASIKVKSSKNLQKNFTPGEIANAILTFSESLKETNAYIKYMKSLEEYSCKPIINFIKNSKLFNK